MARPKAATTESSNTIKICSRLPYGLNLQVGSKTVEIAGINSSQIIGAVYGMTDVDTEFWNAWKSENSKFPALVNGVIFEAGTEKDAKSVYAEVEGEPTGFEPLKPDTMGIETMKA